MRYNLATLAELRVFKPLPYTLELDGERLPAARRCWSRSATVRRTAAACGCARAPLLDDGMLDVVIIKPMSKLELLRVYPRLFKGTHVTHPAYEHHRVRDRRAWPRPGIVGYADGERLGPLPITVEALPAAVTRLRGRP